LAISQEDAMKIRSLVAAANIGFMFLLVLGIKALVPFAADQSGICI
jgi:hypothetical protein